MIPFYFLSLFLFFLASITPLAGIDDADLAYPPTPPPSPPLSPHLSASNSRTAAAATGNNHPITLTLSVTFGDGSGYTVNPSCPYTATPLTTKTPTPPPWSLTESPAVCWLLVLVFIAVASRFLTWLGIPRQVAYEKLLSFLLGPTVPAKLRSSQSAPGSTPMMPVSLAQNPQFLNPAMAMAMAPVYTTSAMIPVSSAQNPQFLNPEMAMAMAMVSVYTTSAMIPVSLAQNPQYLNRAIATTPLMYRFPVSIYQGSAAAAVAPMFRHVYRPLLSPPSVFSVTSV